MLDRCVSLRASMTISHVLERFGLRCVNRAETIEVCSDKLRTSLALAEAGIPQPRTMAAVEEDGALAAVEAIGYPAVMKPTVGSWGRLLAKINDRDAAEAVIEHRATLGSSQQQVHYVQEYVRKANADYRVFVVGGDPVAGIVRRSEHWVTNTARGAKAEGTKVEGELADLSRRAAGRCGAISSRSTCSSARARASRQRGEPLDGVPQQRGHDRGGHPGPGGQAGVRDRRGPEVELGSEARRRRGSPRRVNHERLVPGVRRLHPSG